MHEHRCGAGRANRRLVRVSGDDQRPMLSCAHGHRHADGGCRLQCTGTAVAWASSAPTIEKMNAPHRLDIKHGHRAVYSGVVIGDLLDVLEVEAGFEVVQDWAAEQLSVSAM